MGIVSSTDIDLAVPVAGTPDRSRLNTLLKEYNEYFVAQDRDFDTSAALLETIVPSSFGYIRVGGRLYFRTTLDEDNDQHLQDADGVGWAPVKETVFDLADPIWGVAADRTTDDTEALQAVFDAAEELAGESAFLNRQGVRIILPGWCKISSGLTLMGDNIIIEGSGPKGGAGFYSTTSDMTMLTLGDPLHGDPDSDGYGDGDSANPIFNTTVRNIGFVFDSTIANATDTEAIRCHDWLLGFIDECLFENAHQSITGFRLNSTHIRHNVFRQTGRTADNKAAYLVGMFGRNPDSSRSGNNTFIGNQNFSSLTAETGAGSNCQYGIRLSGCDGWYSSNNHIYQCRYNFAIIGDGTAKNSFTDAIQLVGDYYDSAEYSQILVTGTFTQFHGLQILGCKIRDCDQNAISIVADGDGGGVDLSDIKIECCTIRRAGNRGILITETNGGQVESLKIIGNTFSDNNLNDLSAGCDLDLTGKSIVVSGNTFDGGSASGNCVRLKSTIESIALIGNDTTQSTAGELVNSITSKSVFVKYKGNNGPGIPGDGEAPVEATLASGVLTLNGASYYEILAESGTSDDLDEIDGGVTGQIITVAPGVDGSLHTISVRDDGTAGGSANIRPETSSTYAMNSRRKSMVLQKLSDGVWYERGRSGS